LRRGGRNTNLTTLSWNLVAATTDNPRVKVRSRAIPPRLAGGLPVNGLPGTAALTPRETEVLRWIAEGKSNEEIALILGLSPRTVHKHVEHVLAKLEVPNRVSALLRVLPWPRPMTSA